MFAKLFETAKISGRVVAALALAAALAMALAGCQKDETPSASLTVVCTDQMAQSLADEGVTDAAAWLQQAADEFAAQYEGVNVTIKVVAESEAQMKDALLQNAGVGTSTRDSKTVGGLLKQAFADEPAEGAGENAEGTEAAGENSENAGENAADAEGDAAQATEEQPAVISAPVEDEPVATVDPVVAADPVMSADVIFAGYDTLAAAAYTGKAVALDSLVNVTTTAQIPAGIMAASTVGADGKTYMMPFSYTSYVLVFDADLFSVAGLDKYITVKELPAAEPVATTVAEGEEAVEPEPEPATVESLVADAMATAVLQTWTTQQWKDVLDTLAAKLPYQAQLRLVEAVEEWSVAVEKARLAAEEAGEDPDAAAAKLGEQPTLKTLYTLGYWGQGEEGADLLTLLLRAFGSAYLDQDGYVQVETAEGTAAITWLQYCMAAGILPENAADLSYQDCVDLFNNGQLGIMIIRADQIDELFASAVVEEVVPATEEGQADTTTLVMGRNFGFVTIPVFDTEDAAAMSLTAKQAAAMEDAPAITGQGAVSLPVEVTGFAVMDNGDELTLQIAVEFVDYVVSSFTWQKYAATTDRMPVRADVQKRFAEQYAFGTELADLSSSITYLSGNTAGWDASVAELPGALIQGITAGKTPVEATAGINKACNPAIEAAFRAALLHQ